MQMTGSVWRKWDLHLHTPSSYDYKNKDVSDQELVQELTGFSVEVVAVTDHHIIDVTRIRNLQRLAKDKLVILPGIEFRSELGGSDSIHFIGIFHENCDLDHIWTKIQAACGLTKKDINEKGGDARIHCDLRDTATLIHDLGGLVTVHAGTKGNTIEGIVNSLPYKMALKRDLVIDHIDILELGTTVDQEGYREKVFPNIGQELPMIVCSDNHNIRDYSTKEGLWLKGDPTFETLRQTLFEPRYRVYLASSKPLEPPRRVKKLQLRIAPNVMIQREDLQEETFCFSGVNQDVYFSPYFTSITGGRGTGKSTLLNILHKAINQNNQNSLFDNNTFTLEDEVYDLASTTVADTTTDEIEYLEQNQIESFASDNSEFTTAIYNRIKKRHPELNQMEEQNTSDRSFVFEYIGNIQNRQHLLEQKTQLSAQLDSNIKLAEGISSSEYLALTAAIQLKSQELQVYRTGRERVVKLRRSVDEFLSLNQPIINTTGTIPILYNDNYNKFLNEIATSKDRYLDQQLFEHLITIETKLQNELSALKEQLATFLKAMGISEENLEDIKNASTIADELRSRIEEIDVQIHRLDELIRNFNQEPLLLNYEQARAVVKDDLLELTTVLHEVSSKNPNEVDKIGLELVFPMESFLDRIMSSFLDQFSLIFQKYRYRQNDVQICLFNISPMDIVGNTISPKVFFSSISGDKNYNRILEEIFDNPSAYLIYQALIFDAMIDLKKNLSIQVSYKDRPIELASFGQRCTAVIVVLVMFGNNPIIIDEPEAHLDSSLIANYLVYLLKEKKRDRQIIFATHNANFVVNADCELIYVLEAPTKSTVIIPMTIEDLTNREKLLRLEGGADAFKTRENKYFW